MVLKIILAGLLLIGFSGCATQKSKKSLEIEQLQARINELERRAESKDRDIHNLEEALEAPRDRRSAQAERAPTAAPTYRNIQRALRNAGFDPGPIDGKIGRKTRRAIINFQKENDLRPDGIVGRRTWRKLGVYLE